MNTITNRESKFSFIHDNPKYSTGVLGYDGYIVTETEKAIQFQVGSGKIWLPKSVICFRGDTITVSPWFKYNDAQWKVIEPESTFYS